MNNLSLRSRIFLSYFFVITLSIVAVLLIAYNQVQAISENVFFESFDEKAEIIIDTLTELAEEGADPDEPLVINEIIDLADDFEVAITLFDQEGEWVIIETKTGRRGFPRPGTLILPNLLQDEEPQLIEDEETAQIHLTTLLHLEEDTPYAILRLSEPLEAINQYTRTRLTGLALGTLILGTTLWLILGSWLANALTRPLTDLRHTVQAMAQGQLHTRANRQTPPEIRLLADDFNHMAASVENMVAQQKAFASNAAHELRTPLAAIRIRTETLLEDNPDTALQTQYIRDIHNEVTQLGRLVGDLRLLSQADAQRLVAGQERINLTALLTQLSQSFQPQIQQKALTYTTHLPHEPLYVMASPSHLQVVFRNVLENAIKYSPAGQTLTLTLTPHSSAIHIKITDTGLGIPAQDLPHLFNRFYRVDKAHNRQIPGSGLGLSLTQAILTLYNGTITLHSHGLNQGTTALITLPT